MKLHQFLLTKSRFIYQNRFTTVVTDKACYDYSPIHSLSTEIVQPECNDLIIYNYLLNSKSLNSPNYRGDAANEQIDSTGSKWKNLSDEILHTVSQVRTTFEFSKIQVYRPWGCRGCHHSVLEQI